MLYKTENKLVFETKRIKTLITPCCNRNNKDGKFVTFKGYPKQYGYCHSCGKKTLPPTIYKNDMGEEFIWNNVSNTFVPYVTQLSHKTVTRLSHKTVTQKKKTKLYIDFQVVNKTTNNKTENNLLIYLRSKYSQKQVDLVKKMYYIGTNKNSGCVFWYVNKNQKAQKNKIVYYKINGKRTNYFKVPYKNCDGYYSCLYGEHLLQNNTKPIILVESEKTAIVSSIELPEYTWLAYSGINGLTEEKLKPLSGEKIIIAPDLSKNAFDIISNKKEIFKSMFIDAKVLKLNKEYSDEHLKEKGWYNLDLEDFFRNL